MIDAKNDSQGLVFDLSGVEEPSFEVIPKGDYAAIVDTFELTTSRKGDAMLALSYIILEGEFKDRKLFDFYMLEGKAAEFGLAKLKKFLVLLCPEIDLTSFKPGEFAESGEAIGKELTIKVGIQKQKKGDYAGEARNVVKDIKAPRVDTGEISFM